MKNIIITIIAVLVLLNYVSAIDIEIIAGNQEIAILDVSPSSCKILDSQNDSLSNYTLDGLNFTIEGNNVIINTHPALIPGNYTLVCDYSWTEETEEDTRSSGGGCRTTWECTEWGDCVNRDQTRTCSKVRSHCYAPRKDKPSEFQECEVQKDSGETEEEIIDLEPEEKKKIIWPYFFWGVFILAIIFMWYKAFKKIKKNKNEEKNIQK